MNISSCYTNLSQQGNLSLQMYSNIRDHEDQDHQNSQLGDHQANNMVTSSSSIASSLLYSLSILKDKVNQLQSLLAIILSPSSSSSSSSSSPSSSSIAMATMTMHNTIQDIISTSSSMLLVIQHQTSGNNPSTTTTTTTNTSLTNNIGNAVVSSRSVLGQQQAMMSSYPSTTTNNDHHQMELDWQFYQEDQPQNNPNNNNSTSIIVSTHTTKHVNDVKYKYNQTQLCPSNNNDGSSNCDIIELNAADLLAKYTHYCRICGKGFKRDANLRMHMRAHGDEYKTTSALSNPMKMRPMSRDVSIENSHALVKKYSCPQEGCRWNQRHAKFQPLKSMICVKNHYKRSHCPKMYVCKRCNAKHFSVLSDLRTHEKHCGDLKWQCSCGTTFSRKDKLMGHVSLFHGHTPILINVSSSSLLSPRVSKAETQLLSQAQIMKNI